MAKERVKTKEVVREDRGAVAKRSRSATTTLKLFSEGSSVEELNLTEAEVKLLIDHATMVEEERRAVAEQTELIVAPVKAILKEVAEREGWKRMAGAIGECKISPTTKTETGTPAELAALLKKEGKLRLFNDLVSVKIGDCRKFLGDDILVSSGFFTTETNDFGAVSLKVLKRK